MMVGAILNDPDYRRLKELVLTQTGLAYYSEKDEELGARLSRRLTAVNAQSCASYLALLNPTSAHPSEFDALAGELTIGETYFFRQSDHFEMLRSTILPDLLKRNKGSRRMRIWSAGCATGPEPYSIAILLHTQFAAEIQDWDISILGTDINPHFLDQARTGSFSEWMLRDVPPSLRECCFRPEGKHWVLEPQFRKGVTFRFHNLADDAEPPSPLEQAFDLILCRNVMIYFSYQRIQAVVQRFFARLSEGGWLLVGHAEANAEMFSQFEMVSVAGTMAYRKSGEPGSRPADSMPDIAAPETPPPELSWLRLASSAPLPPEVPLPPSEIADPVSRNESREPGLLESKLEDARYHADRGGWATAESICRGVLEIDPLDAHAHFTLGLILAHTSFERKAIAELRRAVYLDHRFVLAHYHLGTLLQRAGDSKCARRALRNALSLVTGQARDATVDAGDGIQVEELRELIQMHLEVIGA